MARRSSRPGRTLTIYFLALFVIYGLVALAGTWTPALGLDLQGGTRITLAAEGDNIDPDSFDEAARIINDRVNGSGVAEAEVTTQNNRYIVVEIPGETSNELVDTVKRQAQMQFRLVAQSALDAGATTEPSGTGLPTTSSSPGSGVLAPTDTQSPTEQATSPSPTKSTKAGKNRPPLHLAEGAKDKSKDKKNQGEKGASETASPSGSASDTASPSEGQTSEDGGSQTVDDAMAFTADPGAKWLRKFNKFTCPTPGAEEATVGDDPDQPMITCDDTGTYKYLLSAAVIQGTDLTDAQAQIPDKDVNYVVTLSFNGHGTGLFADVSRALYGTEQQFAIVLDSTVISAPTMNGLILDGRAEISGNFTRASAESLATSLRFGSLPIKFESDPLIETIGPSLAGDQLSAGIQAGIAGLLLVMLYCLIYYRGLGTVVVSSLIVAAATTYGLVLLLSKAAGFTLTLPGIAGLIVAVGITADSFIVYFERIRDEMRDGKSMRVAVQAGWVRARNTCVAADTVSLLAAVVLYIFAAGVVKGFAFALGLSTLIDLAVFFWFTHPLVTLLANLPFFNRGHRLSGLDRESLGLRPLTTGGNA